MLTTKDRWINAAATVKVILVASLVLSSCGGQAEPTDSSTSTTQAVPVASWSTAEFENLVEHCEKVYGEPSSSDPGGDGIGPIEVDCRVVVRQNLEEFGCPVEGTYEVIGETRRLIGLDIQFDSEVHSSDEVRDWPLQMQSELDEAYQRAGCDESLILGW